MTWTSIYIAYMCVCVCGWVWVCVGVWVCLCLCACLPETYEGDGASVQDIRAIQAKQKYFQNKI